MTFAEELDPIVEKIIDAAIVWYMNDNGFHQIDGGPYKHALYLGVEVTPPGNPRHAGGQITRDGQPEEWDFDLGTGTDAGVIVYAHFEAEIRNLFFQWRALGEPSEFDAYIDHLRNGAWNVSLTSSGDKVADVANPEMQKVDFLQRKISGDDMGGATILAFDQNFVTPLPTVVHGQYALSLLAGAALIGEKEIWVQARADVLDLAKTMLKMMETKGGGGGTLSLKVVAALANIAGVLPTAAKPILSGASTVLGALDTLLNQDQPTKPEVDLEAGNADRTITKAEEGLKEIASKIQEREGFLEDQMRSGLDTATGGRSGAFDLPTPTLLGETQIDEVKVNFDTLEFLATNTLPLIAGQLRGAATGLSQARSSMSAWYRPYVITGSEYGPFFTWAALMDMTEGLLTDTAWEIDTSADHLEIASTIQQSNESAVEEELANHTTKVKAGSGENPIGDAKKWLQDNP